MIESIEPSEYSDLILESLPSDNLNYLIKNYKREFDECLEAYLLSLTEELTEIGVSLRYLDKTAVYFCAKFYNRKIASESVYNRSWNSTGIDGITLFRSKSLITFLRFAKENSYLTDFNLSELRQDLNFADAFCRQVNEIFQNIEILETYLTQEELSELIERVIYRLLS